jgi:hypothetical protein
MRRVWSERTTVPVSAQFTTGPLTATYVFQAAGAALLRQVPLLFEEMKGRHPQYATWEY